MPTYAIDFETFYSNDVSITVQGIYHYLRHPESDIYLVSIAGDDGFTFVGHPKDAPWDAILAGPTTFLSHNVGFDLPCLLRLQELRHAPQDISVVDWFDTADLTAFLALPRSLKDASKYLLGQEISKDTRDKMKGKRWESMTPEFRAEVEAYALKDAVNCLEIWQKHANKWPEFERKIHYLTREMAYTGVPLSRSKLEAAKGVLEKAVWEAQALIPWAKEGPILSAPMVKAECIKQGIPFPGSLAQDDPEVEAWEDEYAEKYPWIKSLRNYRKGNKHLKTVSTMLTRLRPDGTMAYGLKYFGAHTGRDSGDSGWNAQNLPKGEVCGVDIRACIEAPEGQKLVVVDLSQIEPRVLHWLAGDTKMLDFIRQSPDLYEAQARAWGLFSGEGSLKERDPKLRHKIKQLALGLGYGMGPAKFAMVSKETPEEASRLTALYRRLNPQVKALWGSFDTELRNAARGKDKRLEVELPSGRSLIYRNVTVSESSMMASLPRQGKLMALKLWGGVLTENLIQAVARDVFVYHCLELAKAGYPPCMRVHDEAVFLAPADKAEEAFQLALKIFSTPPPWAEGLPLSADGIVSQYYTK